MLLRLVLESMNMTRLCHTTECPDPRTSFSYLKRTVHGNNMTISYGQLPSEAITPTACSSAPVPKVFRVLLTTFLLQETICFFLFTPVGVTLAVILATRNSMVIYLYCRNRQFLYCRKIDRIAERSQTTDDIRIKQPTRCNNQS